MKRTDAPKKQPVPFAINGLREDLLPSSPSGDNTASYLNGFPPITMTQKSAGGLPPKGQDMNQVLYELSSLGRWTSSGAMNAFDNSFATSIVGYPRGALILGDDGTTIYQSSIDDNKSNPNTGGAGWFNLTNGYLKTASNLSEISSAGASAQLSARGSLGLSALGIGGTGVSLQALDWQTFDFTPGSTYNIMSGSMTNVPTGMQVPSGSLGTIIQVTGYDGTTRHVDAWYSTVTSSSYLRYQIRIAGPVGSKTITVRQVWTSADIIPIANGGTGSSTTAGALSNLGISQALDVRQPLNPVLTGFARLDGNVGNNTDNIPYLTGVSEFATTKLTAFMRGMFAVADPATARSYLGVTDAINQLQPLNASLTSISGLASSANKLAYYTAKDALALTDITALGRTLIGRASATQMQSDLGLKSAATRDVGTGSNQIPDMNSFSFSNATQGFMKYPGGFMEQWFIATIPIAPSATVNALIDVLFPNPFPNRCYGITVSYAGVSATRDGGPFVSGLVVDKFGCRLASTYLNSGLDVFVRAVGY